MERPWMKLYTRDWLDSKELRRCSPLARAVLTDLMCLAHEGIPYGHLSDKVGPLTTNYMASRCVITANQFAKSVTELQAHGRVEFTTATPSVCFIPRMVEDERVRVARAEGGKASIGHPSTHPPKHIKGYPYDYPLVASKGPATFAPESARADSDSGSSYSSGKGMQGEEPNLLPAELRPQTEYPETFRAIQEHDASVDVFFCQRLADEVARAVISDPTSGNWAVEKQRKAVSDAVLARCCREVYATPRKKPPGTGLLLSLVPRIVIGGKLNYA